MGTKKIQAYCFVWILVCCLYSYNSFGSVRDCILSRLSSQVGTTELTGNNDGPKIDVYLSAAGFKPNSREPYCSAFQMWGYKGCGVLIKGVNAMALSWFSNQNKIVMKSQKGWDQVLPCDLFGLYFPSHHRIAHVGCIEKVFQTYIITLEANTSPNASVGSASDRDGDGVYRKKRMKKGIYMVANWIDK